MKSNTKSFLLAATGLIIGLLLAAPLRSWWQHRSDESHAAEHNHSTATDKKNNGETQWYISGMHPWIIQPSPGNCPVCGMELTPLSPDMLTGELAIDPLIVQSMGVRLATVEEGPLQTRWRSFGAVAFDEQLRRSVVLRAPGYVERLHVRYVGQTVAAGDTIAEVHSPAILSALNELRSLQQSTANSAEVIATRERLRVLGLSTDQIAELESAEATPWTVALKSPKNGVVTRIGATEGSWLAAGGELVEINGLDSVWAIATVFESQFNQIREGMEVQARIPNQPHLDLHGTIEYRYPTIDPRTRQGRARVTFDNSDGHLQPGMFLRLELTHTLADKVLHVPREAVLDSGRRQVAFVSLGDGKFDPRTVRAGLETSEGRIAIHEGLSVGEQVVISGQFLLDSESRLRESLLKLVSGETAATQRVQAPVSATPTINSLPSQHSDHITAIIEAYLESAAPLIDDHIEGVNQAAKRLADSAKKLAQLPTPEGAEATYPTDTLPRIQSAAESLARADSISTARTARLALRDLSDALRVLLHATGIPLAWTDALHEVRCPMFPSIGENAWWFQAATTTANPYMGQSMLTCHDQRFALLPTGGEAPEPTAGKSEPVEAPQTESEPDATARGEVTAFSSMSLSSDGKVALAEAIEAYLTIAGILVADSLQGVDEGAQQLRKAMQTLRDLGTKDDAHAFHREDSTRRLRDAADQLIAATDLDSARMAFAIAGEELIGWIDAAGIPPSISDSLKAARCHMFPDHGSFGWWLQREGPLENPLWGPAMLRCADQTRMLGKDQANGDSGEAHSHD
jgi:Cu(I)/Ag(I) efflux system membrane fusion protein